MPTKLWDPPEELVENALMTKYMRWLDRGFETYDDLWRFSVEDLDAFWASIWEYFEVEADYD
jgi:acetoacetyl-CoA synthetase